MAGTIIGMSKIKQLLQLHRQGVSNRKIASLIGMNRETVGDYIQKVKHHGFELGSLLQMEDPALEKLFSAGNPAYMEDRFLVLKEKLTYIEKELKKPGVTRHLLWKEYLIEHPEGYRYSQFCYHLNQLIVARRPSAVLEHMPGEKLYIDFAGHTLPYVDRETGEIIHVQVFVACLPCSDYTFVMAVPSQTTDDFLYALSCCLEHLGGSPKIVVSDNLKSAVIKTDRYEPDLNRVMEDFANHYGFVVIPARPSKPKDKAAVENQVKITYNRVYARLRNELFFSTEELNNAIFEKACLYALEADAVSYKSLQRIIENKTYEWSETNKEEPTERPSHENIRGKEYYTNHLKQTS